jgi:hypothetical protein
LIPAPFPRIGLPNPEAIFGTPKVTGRNLSHLPGTRHRKGQDGLRASAFIIMAGSKRFFTLWYFRAGGGFYQSQLLFNKGQPAYRTQINPER